MTACLTASCGAGTQAYRRGNQAELQKDYDTALEQYRIAMERQPGKIDYQLRYERARFAAAYHHFQEGRRAFERNDLQKARTEFEKALTIDPSHSFAEQELKRVDEALKGNQPPEELPADFEDLRNRMKTDANVSNQLEPKVQGPISFRLVQDSRVAFETVAQLAGLNVIFDPDFRSQRMPMELSDVDIYQALDILSLQTRSFWKPVNRSTILVSPDNQTKRREYEDHILKTIYLTNSVTSTEITEAITALRTLLNMRYIAQSTTMNAILVRDTADRIAIAEKIIEDIDKSKPEVVVEATVLEVDRSKLRELGILPPTGTSLSFSSGTTTTGTTTTSNPNVRLSDLDGVNSSNFSINISESVARFLVSSSDSGLLQTPRVRATDGKLAQIRIGSRVPVPSGSFQPAFAGATGTPVVQFQYVDIGVNLDITPKVLLNREVSMTVLVQVQALAGDRNAGGVTLPVFTNRSIQHEIRLQEGETNILGGIITDSESVSITGIPGLSSIPFLRSLFSQERKLRDQTEIIIMLRPHIVRMPNITELNLRGLQIGTETNTRLRGDSASVGRVAPPAANPAPPDAAANRPTAADGPPSPADAVVRFVPSPVGVVNPGTQIAIDLTGNDIHAVDLTLRYDPAHVSIKDVREGGLLSRDGQMVTFVQRVDTETGTVTISVDRPQGATTLSGSGALLVFTLDPGSRKGASSIRITEFRLRDGAGKSRVGVGTELPVTVL